MTTDPIFAAIDAHKLAVAARSPILNVFVNLTNDAPDRVEIEDALLTASDAEIAAGADLTNICPTTVAGVMAVTTYYAALMKLDHEWIGGGFIDEEAGDVEPRSFEACLIRSLAAAVAQINGETVAA